MITKILLITGIPHEIIRKEMKAIQQIFNVVLRLCQFSSQLKVAEMIMLLKSAKMLTMPY